MIIQHITTILGSDKTLGSDPAEVKAAGLRFVADGKPGIRRGKEDDSFLYFAPDGKLIEDEKILARIRSLGIPPAYHDVWICPLVEQDLGRRSEQ